eukprot:CAMPEP_0182871418 /NCGR_PEP_ID=MMETSP0034_2-20130328/11115_1 /TAXON_ID=156128 /ORGANISM="Nephroselmis pyriformis, Strain CCMP717" /LENGTH=114 /DNA_ID=CAMNT_0025003969 /DNA_START=1 /DNA_END=342 /DNA_ORIENTATION=+
MQAQAAAQGKQAPARPNRRSLLLGVLATPLVCNPALAAPAADRPSEVPSEEVPLIQELLKRSQDNKEKYDKERLDDYYARNFSDYFRFTASSENRNLDPEVRKQMNKFLEEHPG